MNRCRPSALSSLAVLVPLSVAPAVPCLAQAAQWDVYMKDGNQAKEHGQYAEALKLYTLAIEEAEKFGPSDPRLATSLNNLAELYRTQGKYDAAEPLYKRSLAIYEKALGPDHPNVATSLENLANLYHVQGDYAKAEPLYKRSLAIREKALGPDHPNVATSLENYAKFLRATNRQTEAEKLEERAAAIRKAKK